jgi:hypothetical protein
MKQKSHANVHREYNDEKYAALIGCGNMEEALSLYGPNTPIVYSRHTHLYPAMSKDARNLRVGLLVESLPKTKAIVELGGGFGQIAYEIIKRRPDVKYYVGDFSHNAIGLGRRLLPQVEFFHFDFYDTWNVPEGLILTVHAVEMLPDFKMFTDKLGDRRAVLFEPVYPDGTDVLSVCRRSYMLENGYCNNIRSNDFEYDFFGLNPFFPESRLVL